MKKKQPVAPLPKTPRQRIAEVLWAMTYDEMRSLANEFARMAEGRNDPHEKLGGFDSHDLHDWAELLADWAESNP